MATPAWHACPSAEVLAHLATGAQGLSQPEARTRLARDGRNELPDPEQVSAWRILLDQLRNVLILILLVAAALSGVLGHGLEAAAIAIIVLFAVLLGFFQELRAERALAALRQMTAPTARVWRDGVVREVPAAELVPGDVIQLAAGDRVPADARLLEAVCVTAEEACLTGESSAVAKTNAAVSADSPVAERCGCVYSGTTLATGRARAVVFATGCATEVGRISTLLARVASPRTPLQDNLDRVGHVLAIAAFAVVLVIAGLGLWRGEGLLEMFLFGVALAVAVVPEALPAVVTISLAIGVQRMARRHALVRRLPAVETLGSTSVICSDKTGTLTCNEMTVRQIHVGDECLEVGGVGYEPQGGFVRNGLAVPPGDAARELLRVAMLASDATLERHEGRWRVCGDPTEAALVVAAAKAGLDRSECERAAPRIGEIPFSSESKRMTTLQQTPQGTLACVKGAAEIVLAACSDVRAGAGVEPLDDSRRAHLLAQAHAMAAAALRVMAIASRPGIELEQAGEGLVLLGLVGMIDPPRAEAKEAIRTCIAAGITPVMITGDHPLTARAIAAELGLLRAGKVLTGADLDRLDAEQLRRLVPEVEVFARVAPEHKLRIVEAWQSHGRVVAMTGDGVNDAPALKQADIGIAMGLAGTDVAKEAAAMTLADDNFASIIGAVEEGRAIFGNIKKYLMYLLSSNVGEIGLMAAATLAGLPLPLSAVQILYVNLATDGLPALALAVDPIDGELMGRPPRDPRRGIFLPRVVALILVGGLWSACVNVGLFVWAWQHRPLAEAMTLTFVSLVLIQFFKAYNFRSDERSVLRRPLANRWLNLAILWELGLLGAVLYVPLLQVAVGTVPLGGFDLLRVVGVAATVVPVLELTKWAGRRGWLGGSEGHAPGAQP